MTDDWDLHAVVRGFSAFSSPSAKETRDPDPFPYLSSILRNETEAKTPLCDFSDTNSQPSVQELESLCKKFFPEAQGRERSISPPYLSEENQSQTEKQPPRPKFTTSLSRSTSHSQPFRSKRRKIQEKKVVCQVPMEGPSSDMWAWRKYGQKPIKGSPYPRGYYRCSSSKGCPARKQVERSCSDPSMFVIKYTSEHNHALPTHHNLTGITRPKSEPPPFTVERPKEGISPSSSLVITEDSAEALDVHQSDVQALSQPRREEMENGGKNLVEMMADLEEILHSRSASPTEF